MSVLPPTPDALALDDLALINKHITKACVIGNKEAHRLARQCAWCNASCFASPSRLVFVRVMLIPPMYSEK